MAYLRANLFQAKVENNIGINGWKGFQFAMTKIFWKLTRLSLE